MPLTAPAKVGHLFDQPFGISRGHQEISALLVWSGRGQFSYLWGMVMGRPFFWPKRRDGARWSCSSVSRIEGQNGMCPPVSMSLSMLFCAVASGVTRCEWISFNVVPVVEACFQQ